MSPCPSLGLSDPYIIPCSVKHLQGLLVTSGTLSKCPWGLTRGLRFPHNWPGPAYESWSHGPPHHASVCQSPQSLMPAHHPSNRTTTDLSLLNAESCFKTHIECYHLCEKDLTLPLGASQHSAQALTFTLGVSASLRVVGSQRG